MIYKSVKGLSPSLYPTDFFENQPNEICSHLSEKALKGRFLKLEKEAPNITVTKEKERRKERARRRKGGEEKKAVVTLRLSFYNSYFGNARFHAQFQLDLHSFDQNILSFENSLF